MMKEGPSMDRDEGPPPLYENDHAWTKEREKRMDAIYDGLDRKTISTEEGVKQIGAMIEEVDKAIRDNPKTLAGMSIVEVSAMMQRLLYSFYSLHKRLEKGE